MGAMKVWDGTMWQTVAPFSERASCYVGPDAPTGATYAGDLWWDTDDPTIAYPGAELAYNENNASVTITATTAASAQQVVGGTSLAYDGSPIIIDYYCPLVQAPNVGAQSTYVMLWDGSTDLNMLLGRCYTGAAGSAGAAMAMFGRRRLTPSVGTHSYRALAYADSNPGYAWYLSTLRITRV